MASMPLLPLQGAEPWALWNSYAATFLTHDGRIVDPGNGNRTSSEAQAYAMFFALVANDRRRFDLLLDWTEKNLAAGDLGNHLPAWNWGESPAGTWTILDRNSASDADLWLAYTLLEAGKLWGEPRFTSVGERLAGLIAREEVEELPRFGRVLLPGVRDFKNDGKVYLNLSYTPIQVLLALAGHCPGGPWKQMAGSMSRLVKAGSPHGFALDWIAYEAGKGVVFEAPSGKKAVASYDAIRVYLWAGMLPEGVARRSEMLSSLSGMSRLLAAGKRPPAIVNVDGAVENEQGSVGYSAALVPFLMARGEHSLAATAKEQVKAAWNRATGLYGAGTKPDYYDQNLILFSMGWLENRYRFEPYGGLNLLWRNSNDSLDRKQPHRTWSGGVLGAAGLRSKCE